MEIAALVFVAVTVGVGVAWLFWGRGLARTEALLRTVQQSASAAEVRLAAAQSEHSALGTLLQERSARIAALEAALQEREGLDSRIAELRERVGKAEADCAGYRRAVAERDVELTRIRTELEASTRMASELGAEKARLEQELDAERRATAEKLALLKEAEVSLREAFTALSAEALKSNNQSFLDLAKTQLGEFQKLAQVDLDQRSKAIGELVTPIGESLKSVDSKLQDLEKVRAEAYGALKNQLQSVAETQRLLHTETSNLVRALRSPSVRGRWGEVQLRRVVELAGMAEHCDFTEQPVADVPESRVRPDLIVHLPAGKQVIVDAKVPLDAYLRALEAPDEATRASLLQEHARQVRDHMTKLAGKNYWIQFEHSPDHVVMFIPGEVFFFSALQHDPELIEYGVGKNVFVAGPTTLISLLRTVAYGWRQERIAENAQAISKNGRELYERIGTLADHFRDLGRGLTRSVEAYNEAMASLEKRVLPGARRFRELGAASGEDIEPIEVVDRVTRQPQAPELQPDGDSGT